MVLSWLVQQKSNVHKKRTWMGEELTAVSQRYGIHSMYMFMWEWFNKLS